MKVDQAGDDVAAAEIARLGATRRAQPGARADPGDPPVGADHHRRIRHGAPLGAVDQGEIGEHRRPLLRRRRCDRRDEREEDEDQAKRSWCGHLR